MTTETLMTEAATTTEGTTASDQAAPQTATGADGGGQQQQQQAIEGQAPHCQQADGDKVDGAEKDKQEGAPESYSFKAPEGVQFDEAVIRAFSEVAKDLNMPQDHAQKVLDKMAPVIAARQLEQFESARNQWAADTKADKELGGDRLDENLGVAKKAFDAFATPELRALLNDSGLGNHPEVVRVFYRVGNAISEDRFVAGKAVESVPGDARRLYAASNMNP